MPENKIETKDLSKKEAKKLKEDFYRQMGFESEKQFEKYNKKARSIWKSKQRKIIYEDELTNREIEMIEKDITVSRLAKQMDDTQTAIVYRINQIIKKNRNYKEE